MDEAAPLDAISRELEELRASRARVVAAADRERRRIERELHDGAQQHLVALAVNLQLARELADSDPDALKAHLEEISQDVRDALESVRALAHGIYPPLLLDLGLADALRGAAGSLAIPTRVEAPPDRYAPDIEAAAYFCCLRVLEAIDAAQTEARATVRVWPEHESLHFEIVVDGVAEYDRIEAGATLAEVNDRLGAVDGRLNVLSEPGGTRIAGTIPLTG